ncbi:glucose 1-dehydrogenase [Cycloclasticus sp.]|uniref:SDR family NAD(P)-dependent oxidoreductase n=1 Tax=Cycloclasticus sp. TaxID=2024830 RepID=UPI000C10A249|nr:glucose 1-dehydrogenase [Cycloclasticus sp.]PHR50624.1 MAG: short-chain dehydrogenase [Cycloclasticus sp.]
MSQYPAFSLDLFRLDGQIALVTGAGCGLGNVFARALAAAGATVVSADINLASAEQTAEEVRLLGGKALSVEVDVSDVDSVAAMNRAVLQAYGRLDILVNNAGVASPADRIHEMPVEDWDRVNAVNTRGVFLCTKAVLPQMMAQKKGSIINISSVAGLGGVSNDLSAVAANYSASKGAVATLTKQIAVEYGNEGIRCNAIAPGWHLGTQLGREALPLSEADIAAMVEKLHGLTPLNRTGDPEELAGLLVYLASDAASFMTGQVIAHDGGWTAW